ncbi:CHAP domain-containing protein [Demequina silvatica]|uniref:CHAP domain-containing protein n=1 Tax=Demequina silvatica TaxID=1638988 RepID=UPI0007843944|nr:SH3 domain-containing protein [Demequina silvatica]
MTTTSTRRRAAGLVAGLLVVASVAAGTGAAAAPAATNLSTAPLAAAPAAGKALFVDKYKLAFRWKATYNSNTRLSGFKNARVVATGNAKNGFIEVNAAGLKAWAPAEYLTAEKPSWKATKIGTKPTSIKLRAKPSVDANVVATAPRGTVGTYQKFQSQGWWRVKIDGKASWAKSNLLWVGGHFDVDRILEVAHSQVGYREPAFEVNKYNTWINGSNPWCEVFVAWVFDKSGYKAGVPKHDTFREYYAELEDLGILDKTPTKAEMKKGTVVLLDWGLNEGPKHTAIVDHVSGDYVYLVEGNTTDGTGDNTRGVFYRARPMSYIWAWYSPPEYARVTM